MGSFFTVVGLRIPIGASIIYPPSHCDFCERRLTASELIPVLSFFLRKGRCHTCSQRIPIIYPLIECFTGFLFVFILFYSQQHHQLLFFPIALSLSFGAMLIILTISDLAYFLIPNQLLLFFVVLFSIFHIFFTWIPWINALLGAGVSLAFLYLASLVIKNGMGYGDIKLFGVLGFVLGWQMSLLTLFIACFIGSWVTLVLLLIHKKKRKTPIPFVPFISIGALIAYFYGDTVLQIYMSFMKNALF